MKKAIAIIILGLLVCGSSLKAQSQDFNYLEILLNNEVVLDVDGKKYRLQFMPDGRLLEYYDGDSWQNATWKKINDRGKFEFDYSKVKDAVQSQTLQIDFKNLTWNIYGKNNKGKSYDTTWKIISPTPKLVASSSTSTNTDDKIAQAKQICKDLGFKTKTEKFADCSLKMLSIQFEVQNRETSSDGGTEQKIVVNQGYSVGDAMIALSGIISDANNVRSSYGGGNCRIFQHAYHASLKCN